MSTTLLELFAAFLRFGLISLGGVLIEHHILTADQTDRFTNDIVAHAIIYAPVVAGLAWQLCAKWRSRVLLATAIDSHKGDTEAEIKDRIARGNAAPVS